VYVVRFIFNESVRGLVPGAPIDFRGIELGKVTNIGAKFEASTGVMSMTVDAEIYPQRLMNLNVNKNQRAANTFEEGVDVLVAGGMRAQLRTGSFVSGQLLVSLDFVKGAPKAKADWSGQIPVLPTIPGSLERIEKQATDLLQAANDVLQKLNALPLDKITDDLRTTIKTLDSTLKTAETMMKNVDRQLADDSQIQQDLRDTLREVSRAAAEARTLLEYQSRYPESLIKGKAKEE
jgi:paraquat-inducible protein B